MSPSTIAYRRPSPSTGVAAFARRAVSSLSPPAGRGQGRGRAAAKSVTAGEGGCGRFAWTQSVVPRGGAVHPSRVPLKTDPSPRLLTAECTPAWPRLAWCHGRSQASWRWRNRRAREPALTLCHSQSRPLGSSCSRSIWRFGRQHHGLGRKADRAHALVAGKAAAAVIERLDHRHEDILRLLGCIDPIAGSGPDRARAPCAASDPPTTPLQFVFGLRCSRRSLPHSASRRASRRQPAR